MATTMPLPGLVGQSVCSSIHPLKTHPNPPSPRKDSDRKFLVAFFRSFKVKDFKLALAAVSPLNDDQELITLVVEVVLLEFVELEVLLLGS